MRTDDMVRDALADLAPVAPADATALAGMHRAIHRRRRRQHVARIAAAVIVLALAVGAATAVALEAESDPADYGTGQTTSTPTAPTTPGTAEGGSAGRIAFGAVAFQLPEGWEVVETRDEQSPLGGPIGQTMCVAPVDADGNQVGYQWEGCSGLLIHQGEFLPGNEWQPYQPHSYWAFSHSTDPGVCPAHPDDFGDLVQAADPGAGMPVEQGERQVGERTASYDRWEAVCELSGFTFEPEAWYLPVSKVLVFDIFDHPETEAFLASFEFEE